MTQADLLKSLGLDDTPAPDGAGVDVQITTQPAKPALEQTRAALVLDRWTKRQGRQLHKSFEAERNSANPRPIHQMSSIDLADLHQSVFDPSPEFAAEGTCSDIPKWKYFQELNDTPGFHELRESTVLDDAATELAIDRLSDGLATVRAQQKEKGGDGGGDDDSEGDIKINRVAGKAVNQARQDVRQLDDTREAMGIGTGAGSGGAYDVKATLDLYKRLRSNCELQRIINLAGKYRLFGQSQQRRKVAHGYDDMVGVTVGDDLARLTQSEFLALGIPELEDDVCRRLLDHNAMIQEFHGYQPVAKGPMIIAIDESGSMMATGPDGFSRIQHAKALALAFAYIARQQHRWCALIGWASASERRTLVLAPDRWDHEALLAWITGFWNGGTEPPLADMPEIYRAIGAPEGKTDLCYITDGAVYINLDQVAEFNAWKQSVNAKVITLAVASTSGQMNLISDEVHEIKALGLNDATAKVLSI